LGLGIDRERFDESDYVRFRGRLDQCLTALRELLDRPRFGEGDASLGAELELFLVDASAAPLPLNQAVLAETVDPRMTVELDRFNLECNLRWSPLAGRPFAALRHEFEGALAELRRAAATLGGRVAMIGVLPTLRAADLARSAMTDSPRFRALSAGIRRLRRGPFLMKIHGDDPLEIACDDVTFEGAATSMQLHLRVSPDSFARVFNALQLATAPCLAVSGNSPTFLGHRLWEETRVALFKQSVDARGAGKRDDARVSFGSGWVQEGAYELFVESVEKHEPLLPVIGDEDPLACVRDGGVPLLEEVRLHQGTVWSWNRPVYDPAGGGHLRIEARALPAGPTVVDMLANAAFLVGTSLAFAADAAAWTAQVPFDAAHRNFYRAAQQGLSAKLIWPKDDGDGLEEVDADELVRRLLPAARRGLAAGGVASEDSDPLLEVIEARARSGRTGAVWQREALARLEATHERPRALAEMLERYIESAEGGLPVDRWDPA
jgi:gamma-glutamyl:cysteine ligase YbdK (ATP-grasp superfamily)